MFYSFFIFVLFTINHGLPGANADNADNEEGKNAIQGNNCSPNKKFRACCQQIGMTSTMVNVDNLVDTACQYEPKELSLAQKIALGFYLTEYTWCYADGQDNSAACGAQGVPNDVIWGLFFHADCQDFCRGNGHGMEAKHAYAMCDDYKSKISTSNENANNMETDTAMQVYKMCKGTHCDRPMQWKELC